MYYTEWYNNYLYNSCSMRNTPFMYGTTVSDKSFTNREKEIEKLENNLLGGINTMIISPRRWGKSSLVEKVISGINKKTRNYKTVIIDMFSVSSEEEFLEIFAREVLKASSSKWQDWMNSGKEFFRNLIPKISIGADPKLDFSLSFDWKEIKKHSDEILNLPEIIAQKKHIYYLICLDEFQNLSSFNGFEQLEKKMRSVWQKQKLVTYCIYGSKRHMMTNIFNNPSKPFYRFGDIMLLSKIETQKWIDFICEGFSDSGKIISKKDAELISQVMENNSWYVQQLAQYTWNKTPKNATVNEIKYALKELIQANMPLYQREIESLSTTQLNLLKAVAKGETRFTSARVMQDYHLGTPRNVSKNKTILVNNDLIQEVNGVYGFADPAFGMWFNEQFNNKSYLNI